MPTLQIQPRSTPVTAGVAARGAAEFRPLVALAFVAGVLTLAGIALAEHGIATWVCAAIGIYVASVGIRRLLKEHALLAERATTIATVTHWEKSELSDGGYDYSVQYRFLGPNGKEYVGRDSSQEELPQHGEMLPVSYLCADPRQNLPLATFWFYRFTYTGFAGWMD
jgi:hypothetical protein